MEVYEPTDLAMQLKYFPSHPLVIKDYTIVTPSIPPVLNIVAESVMLHKRSICFRAHPQMGKSTVCRLSRAAIDEGQSFKDRFCLMITADPRRHEHIIRTIVRNLNLPIPNQPKLENLRRDALAAIENKLRLVSGRHFVLLIDEIQALLIPEYEHLQFLQNELALQGIGMTVIGFAQTQVNDSITLLREQGRPELLVRFLNEVYDLPHCTNVGWLTETLTFFDEKMTYPSNIKCTYTEFFLPLAFAGGFRLADSAKLIFFKMEQAIREASLKLFPTAHVLEVCRLILIRAKKLDHAGFELPQDVVKAAVAEANLASYTTNLTKR
jgi:hypothetical protein